LTDALAHAKERGLRVTAALPVHLNGQCCDMAEFAKIADQANLALIEDACHSLGVPGIGANLHSTAACFSTHAVKAITTAEGGVVTTRDTGKAARMRSLRSHGMVRDAASFQDSMLGFDGATPNPWYYEMHELGWNYRLPDVLCALGISQLRKLERFYRRRQEIAALYDRLLAPLAPVVRPVTHGGRPHGWHLYAVLVDFVALDTTRRRFMEALHAAGVGTQVHYLPVYRQPYYSQSGGEEDLDGAEAYYSRCLSIPLFPSMSDDDVAQVVASLRHIVGERV
jgi:dTDP-4-amino-4,6-dideoxygalactose transaminase